jgi:HEAT repeat protein
MDELKDLTERIHALAEMPETPGRRALAYDALGNKWEGIQAIAIQTLGRWGGRESVSKLRAFLEDAFQRKSDHGIRGVAVRNLAGLITAEDADWILDLYFGLPESLLKHEVAPLVSVLPPRAGRARLLVELRSADRLNRRAAVRAVGTMAFPDRRQLLWPLREDDDSSVRKMARAFTHEA